MFKLLLTRLSNSSELDAIEVVNSEKSQNDQLQYVGESLGYQCTRGSEKKMLKQEWQLLFI